MKSPQIDFPVSGFQLARDIQKSESDSYTVYKRELREKTADHILASFGITPTNLENLFHGDLSRSLNLQLIDRTVRSLSNAVLTPGTMGISRTYEQLRALRDALATVTEEPEPRLDSDTLAELRTASTRLAALDDPRSKMHELLYSEYEEARQVRTGMSTRMSRIRVISDWVKNAAPEQLFNARLSNTSEAAAWVKDVLRNFAEDSGNHRLQKFIASYEGAWLRRASDLLGVDIEIPRERPRTSRSKTIGSTDQQTGSAIERIFTQAIEQRQYPSLRAQVADSAGRRSDFTSASGINLDMKIFPSGYEATFEIAPERQVEVAGLQVTALMFWQGKFPDSVFEVRALADGRCGFTLKADARLIAQEFGAALLELMQELEK